MIRHDSPCCDMKFLVSYGLCLSVRFVVRVCCFDMERYLCFIAGGEFCWKLYEWYCYLLSRESCDRCSVGPRSHMHLILLDHKIAQTILQTASTTFKLKQLHSLNTTFIQSRDPFTPITACESFSSACWPAVLVHCACPLAVTRPT